MLYLIVYFAVLLQTSISMTNAIITGEILSTVHVINRKTTLTFGLNNWGVGKTNVPLEAGSRIELAFLDDFENYFKTFAASAPLSDDQCLSASGFGANEKLSCKISPNSRIISVTISEKTLYTFAAFKIVDVLNPELTSADRKSQII